MMNRKLSLEYVFRESQKASGENSQEKSPLLLLLHGIGSHEEDLFGLAPYLDRRFFIASCRAPVALSYGGFAWFELFFTPQGISLNFEQAESSRQVLLKFIDELIDKHDLDAEKVFLCGFSQGAIMSYAVALTEPEKIAAVAAMSGRVVPEIMPDLAAPERLKDFPFLVVHGTLDSVLSIEDGRAAKDFLEKLPVKLDYREYEMAHQVSEESLADVAEWLRKQI